MGANRVSDRFKFRGQLGVDSSEFRVPVMTIGLKDWATAEMDSFKRCRAEFVDGLEGPIEL